MKRGLTPPVQVTALALDAAGEAAGAGEAALMVTCTTISTCYSTLAKVLSLVPCTHTLHWQEVTHRAGQVGGLAERLAEECRCWCTATGSGAPGEGTVPGRRGCVGLASARRGMMLVELLRRQTIYLSMLVQLFLSSDHVNFNKAGATPGQCTTQAACMRDSPLPASLQTLHIQHGPACYIALWWAAAAALGYVSWQASTWLTHPHPGTPSSPPDGRADLGVSRKE